MIQRFIIGKYLAGKLKDAGEGKYGTKVQAVYNFLALHALDVGMLLWLVDYKLRTTVCGFCGAEGDGVKWLGLISDLLMGAGLAISLHAADGPNKNAPGAVDPEKK